MSEVKTVNREDIHLKTGTYYHRGDHMSLKKNLLLVIFFSLALLLASCTGSSGKKNSQENSSDIKTMPQGIKDIEKSLQEIMRQADLVPIIGKLASGQEGYRYDL